MESQEKKSNKPIIDKIYDIVTVQLIGVAVFVIIALIIKLIGGNFYLEARALYYDNFDNETTIESVTGDNTSSDTESNTEDTSSGEGLTEITSDESGNKSESETESELPQKTEQLVSTSTSVANKNSLIWPLVGKITSTFGSREPPVQGVSAVHKGIDIARNWGVPIQAAADGNVYFVGENDGYGKYIIVIHSGNFKTLYAHCSEIIAKVGDVVKQGDIIAEVGNTGNTTGSHLHFETIIGGTAVNPVWLLPDINNV